MSMTDQTNHALQIAEWVDTSLNETLEQTLDHKATRVFLVFANEDGYERRLVISNPDPYSALMTLPDVPTDIAGELIAGCFVMTGWMTKVADLDEDGEPIDTDEDEERIRVRVIAAVTDDGISTVVRKFGSDGNSDSFADGGEGMFPDAMNTWWAALNCVN